jgi:acetate kinase
MTGSVLVLNAGSSSLKYQVLDPASERVSAKGLIERIGETPMVPDHHAAITEMLVELESAGIDLATSVAAVGHRVVHGGSDFSAPVVVDDDVLGTIRDLIPLAPLHNPGAVAGIEAARERVHHVPHVAVFDTAFFATLAPEAYTYALPRQLAEQHRIRRYGFHGTSHQYVSEAAARFLGRDVRAINQIVFHLGNGCSVSAVSGGIAVDTSMGLTPLQGLVMGTRSGDVDPGLHAFLHRELGLSIQEIDSLLNKESGLKGMCGSNDFREIQARRAQGDAAVILAYDVYVHRLRHYLGAYLAELGSVDVISFTAGVGENNPSIRADVLRGLRGLGIDVDDERNAQRTGGARVISPDGVRTQALVVPTNEELAIARQAAELVARP